MEILLRYVRNLKSLLLIQESLSLHTSKKYSWLQWDNAMHYVEFLHKRLSREEIPENIKEQLIVELYSK